ncbi:MAG: hypothetical protein K8823_538 [Cenarchaeum symbiont of Oopsacas minuta]|nr:hypothetical protein [Cenarchaeum symbiont of Oopsacas minuta]
MTDLRVHVAPVGYEEDRIVIPALQKKADRVWLLVHSNPSVDRALQFTDRISKKLKDAKIEVVIEPHDRTDFFNIIKCVKSVIEKEKKNTVYINLASGSKIQSIALMMGCMTFSNRQNIRPFYAEAERYPGRAKKQISYGIKNIMDVPAYRIQTPKPALITALHIIRKKGGRITKKHLAKLAIENDIIRVGAKEENKNPASLTSLAQNVIRPLEDEWGYIKVEKIGRNRWVELTEEGHNVTEFLS